MVHLHLSGITSLDHISQWNDEGLWTNCNVGDFPNHIKPLGEILKRKLTSSAPINQHLQDKIGWKSS